MKIIPSGHKSLIVDYDENLKSHLRIFDDADEALITSYIRSAGEYIEKYIGLPILSNQFTVIGYAKDQSIELPKGTVSVQTIQERRQDGTWLEVDATTDQLDNYGVYCMYYDEVLQNGFEYKIDVITECQISMRVKQAAYFIIAEMYEQRENRGVKYPMSANALLDAESLLL